MTDAEAIVARVRATIAERALLRGGERVVLAVSGGPDSMTLLHAMLSLAGELDLTLHVAHVDHRLREDSDKDAALVEHEAASAGLPFHLHVADPSPERGVSPEDRARRIRLGFLSEVAREVGASRIATGHTRDDQAETVLMRLVQGTGRRGLGGMTPRRWYTIRPLIDLRRSETEGFCRTRGLQVAMDPTNLDRRIVRNQIRWGALPMLRDTLNAQIVDALARLADVAREEDAYLDAQAAAGIRADPRDEETHLDIEALRGLPRALQRRALRLATWTHNGATFAFEHTDRLLAFALQANPSAVLDLPEGIRARVEYGSLVLGPRTVEAPPAAVELIVPGETALAGWDMRVQAWVTNEPVTTWPDGKGMCVVDADRIERPLQVRAPADGDRFTPLGVAGTKKLGDLFTDARIPRARRPLVPILTDASDSIVWVIGHRIDARAAVSDSTTRFLWMSTEGAP